MDTEAFIETAKDHFETIMLPKLTAISEEVVSHMLVFVEGSVAYGFCDEKSDVDIDYYINIDADESTRQQIRELFTGETYWHKGVRVSYGFGGKYWKFDLLMNDAMDQFWEEFDPYALKNITLAVPLWDPDIRTEKGRVLSGKCQEEGYSRTLADGKRQRRI